MYWRQGNFEFAVTLITPPAVGENDSFETAPTTGSMMYRQLGSVENRNVFQLSLKIRHNYLLDFDKIVMCAKLTTHVWPGGIEAWNSRPNSSHSRQKDLLFWGFIMLG